MKNSIRLERYEAAHGRKPRGRGGWWFEDRSGKLIVRASGLFSEARKVARDFVPEDHDIRRPWHGRELWVSS